MGRLLIAGCGDVGTALGLRLTEDGHQVWGLRRSHRALPAPIRPVAGDLTRAGSLRELPRSLDAVVFAAAAPEHTDGAYRTTYVEGLDNLIRSLVGAGQEPARLVFTSSTGVYHQDDGSWVDERSVTAPSAFSGRRMLEAENVLRAAPWTSIAVRFGGIYGPGRTRLIDRARNGEASSRASSHFTNRIHIDDCAAALRHLLALPSPSSLYVAVDDEPACLAEVLDFIRRHRGWPRPPAPDDVGRKRGKRCSNARLRASGFRFRHPTYREGYASMLERLS